MYFSATTLALIIPFIGSAAAYGNPYESGLLARDADANAEPLRFARPNLQRLSSTWNSRQDGRYDSPRDYGRGPRFGHFSGYSGIGSSRYGNGIFSRDAEAEADAKYGAVFKAASHGISSAGKFGKKHHKGIQKGVEKGTDVVADRYSQRQQQRYQQPQEQEQQPAQQNYPPSTGRVSRWSGRKSYKRDALPEADYEEELYVRDAEAEAEEEDALYIRDAEAEADPEAWADSEEFQY